MPTRDDLAAIFFDLGGVFTSSPFEAFSRFERERGLPDGFLRGVNTTNPLDNAWARLESARIDAKAFDAAFAAESRAQGHEVRGRDVLPLLAGTLRPRMVRALRACRTRYRCACLTNNVHPMPVAAPPAAGSAEAEPGIESVMALFDVVVESSREGVRKPEPAFYRIACERSGVAPHQVVFLDDLGINLKPARAMGMTTIKVLDEAQALADLAAVTGLSFPP
jgi:putative hydrolase of the HAD superfamily